MVTFSISNCPRYTLWLLISISKFLLSGKEIRLAFFGKWSTIQLSKTLRGHFLHKIGMVLIQVLLTNWQNVEKLGECTQCLKIQRLHISCNKLSLNARQLNRNSRD